MNQNNGPNCTSNSYILPLQWEKESNFIYNVNFIYKTGEDTTFIKSWPFNRCVMKEIGKRGYQLSNFDVVSKIFHNYLKKLLKYPYILQILIFVRPYFIHILQLTWLIARDWTQKQLFNYWDLQKCRTTCHSTHYFYFWKIN